MRKTISLSLLHAGQSVVLAAFTIFSASLTYAQVVIAPTTPQIGSSQPVTADPLVRRPNTKPCVVQLFTNLAFENFTPASFNYTPPANCPGPWAKVVFTADFTVQAGNQFDRSAAFYIGHANIYYGTTAEPSGTLSPSWHVERDVTDLSAILKSPQTGEANLGNSVGIDGLTSVIFANAALEFFPASFPDPAPRTPDIVVPVNGTGGDAGTLNTGADQITQTLNLPTNVESVYLDIIAQNQIDDEFWYFCVPNNETTNLDSCGNTAFRETEITIDGKPAGVAPVYPWIFTGGFDPFMWMPIPGVQTLEFKPYRVDLTPFAGLLSDGNQHTVAVSVFNADDFFLATANLLVFTDHGTKHVTGGIISNNLAAAPSPVVNENVKMNPNGPTFTGSVSVSSNRNFTIRGYVNTSHGRVETTVSQSMSFLNTQQFDVVDPTNPSVDDQNAEQTSTVDSVSTTQQGPLVGTKEQHFSYPLTVDFSFVINADGSEKETTKVNQQFLRDVSERQNGLPIFTSSVSNQVQSSGTEAVDTSGNLTTPSQSSQKYFFEDSKGNCFSKTLTAENQVLTNVTNGQGCRENR
jgi:hypothetical protein